MPVDGGVATEAGDMRTQEARAMYELGLSLSLKANVE